MAKTVIIDGREISVTICPPGRSALPWHLTDVEESPIGDNILDLMRRQGVCPDDCEHTAPFIDGDYREEEDAFFSRPLKFKVDYADNAPVLFDVGFNLSVADELRKRKINSARSAESFKR